MTAESPRIHRNAILAICCVVQGMVVLDVTIVNIALPSIQSGLHMSDTEQQWVINAYTLVFGGFLLLGGRAADLFGRRRVFLFGLTLFSAASFVGGLATSGPVLIGARAFQGLGGAILAPASLSTLTTTFAEGPARTRALTYWSMTAATGGTLGTVMGGVLTDQLDWRWVLWVNVPIAIGVFIAALRFLHVPREDEAARRPLDVPGAVTVTAGLAILIYAIVTTDQHAWGSLHTIGLMALGIGLLVLFVVLEARSREPLVPLRIFRSRSLVGADMTSFLLGGLIVGQIFFTSQFIQRVNGFSPLHAGLAMLVPTLAALVSSLVSGRIVGRVGPRAILIAGPLMCAAGSVWLAQADAGDSFVTHLGLPICICILGTACCFVPMTMCATSGVPQRDAGLASGLLNSSRQVGGALFLAILVTIAHSETVSAANGGASPDEALAKGFDRGLLITGFLALAVVVVAITIIPRFSRVPEVVESIPVAIDAEDVIAVET